MTKEKKVTQPKKSVKKQAAVPRPTNVYDFGIVVANHLYNLANTGNVVGLAILGLLSIAGVFAWRIPEEQIPNVIHLLLDYVYVIPVCGALTISLFGNWIQRKVYNKHIQNLIEDRDKLMFGLASGQLTQLNNDSSSGIDVEETHNDL